MGFFKSKQPILAPAGIRVGKTLTLTSGLRLPVENVNTAAAAPTLSPVGVSFITYGTSGQPGDVILPNPPAAGIVKHIFVVNNTTSVELNINTRSSASPFFGTTYNTATISAASTGSPGGTPAGSAYLGLVAQSTDVWAVFPGSTFNWDFSASTGSSDADST